jgi:hypothetical protein
VRRPTYTRDLYSHLGPEAARRARRNAMVLGLSAQGWSDEAIADVLLISRQLVQRVVSRGEGSTPRIRRMPVDTAPEVPAWLARLALRTPKG